MPGVLIIEAMAQAAGILVLKTMDKKTRRWFVITLVGSDKHVFKASSCTGIDYN